MSESLHIFSKDMPHLLTFMEVGRTGELPVSVQRSRAGFVVRIGNRVRVSGSTLAECQRKIPGALKEVLKRLK